MVWCCVLALGWLVGAIAGVVRGQPGLLAFGLGMAGFFGWVAWFLRPTTVDVEKARRQYNRQNAVFKRLGIRRLIGPDWTEDDRS